MPAALRRHSRYARQYPPPLPPKRSTGKRASRTQGRRTRHGFLRGTTRSHIGELAVERDDSRRADGSPSAPPRVRASARNAAQTSTLSTLHLHGQGDGSAAARARASCRKERSKSWQIPRIAIADREETGDGPTGKRKTPTLMECPECKELEGDAQGLRELRFL
ncbi:MAG: hypothetical protein MZV70_16665 [Desulfobacterales bacterium]|nr:hypothetical protein [Desulfobacterales bacterium]